MYIKWKLNKSVEWAELYSQEKNAVEPRYNDMPREQ